MHNRTDAIVRETVASYGASTFFWRASSLMMPVRDAVVVSLRLLALLSLVLSSFGFGFESGDGGKRYDYCE